MIPGIFAGGMNAGVATGYLDGITPPPRAALSLRKMISTATVAIRVRRSSDNAEQDIGFSGDALDTTALASFVGANSAYVTTRYDQTGNGYHQVQATAANQPRIVNAGVIDVALIYDGTSDAMSIASLPFGTPHVGLYTKSRISKLAGTYVAYETSANYNSGSGRLILAMISNQMDIGVRGSSAAFARQFNYTDQSGLNLNVALYQMAVADGTTPQHRLYINGSNVAAASTFGVAEPPVKNFTSQTMYIGARAGTSLHYPLWDETLVVYDADTTSVRASIEAIVA